MARNPVGEIRLVGQQDGGFAGRNVVQSFVEIGGFAENVVHSCQPKSPTIALDGHGLVGEDMNSLRGQSICNAIGIGEYIMISQHSPETVGRLEIAEQPGTRLGCRCRRGMFAKERHRHEIASQYDQLGTESIDYGDCRTDRVNREVGIVMEVAEQRDIESVEVSRPAAQTNFAPHELWAIGLNENSVRSESGYTRARCETYEFSSVNRKKRQSMFWVLRF